MKFFIDTANIDEVRTACSWGIIAGATTNPTLVSKEGNVDFHTRVREIAERRSRAGEQKKGRFLKKIS